MSSLSCWGIRERDFPSKGKIEKKIRFLLGYAILAPSNHNSQPWKFRIKKNELEIWADREQKREKSDPGGREMWISVGAAIANLEIAADHFGVGARLVINEGKDDLGAVIEFGERWTNEDGGKERLFGAITKRWTDRGIYEDKEIPMEQMREIVRTAKTKGAELELIGSKSKKESLGELLYQSNWVWFKSRDLLEELTYWLKKDAEVGQSGQFLWLTKLPRMTSEFGVMTNFSKNEVEEKANRDREMVGKSAGVGIIWSRGDEKIDWIRSGIAYERAALKMTTVGVGNAFFNTVIELESQREKLGQLIGKGRPQLIFRIGYSRNERNPTSRRMIKLTG